MTAEVRRGIVLAVAGLLGGFAMVVALFGTGELLKRNAAGGSSAEAPAAAPPGKSDGGAPLAALAPPPQGKTPGLEAGPGPEQVPAGAEGAPTFDIVRVEPDGASVVAGRTVPNARVELLRDGKPFASGTADATGQFALTPPDLPPGSSEIALRAFAPDGKPLPGRESVTVVVAEKRDTKPLIALSAPDAPTRVLSQPDAPEAGAGRPATAFAEGPGKAAPESKATEPDRATDAAKSLDTAKPADRKEIARTEAGKAARSADAAKDRPATGTAAEARREAAPRIVSIDAQDGGRLDVTAQASAESTLRLYLNDTLVASGRPGPDGRIAFTIGRGVRPGAYQVRIDSVDPAGGKVRRRAEVSFTYPDSAAARVAAAEKPADKPADPQGLRKSTDGRPAEGRSHEAKANEVKANEVKANEGGSADARTAERVPAQPSPRAPADSVAPPSPGQAAAKPEAKPDTRTAAPKTAETATSERRGGASESAEAWAGQTQAHAQTQAQNRMQLQRPDPRPAETAPGSPAEARGTPSQAAPAIRPAPSLAGAPASAPRPAAASPGTATPGTPSVAAGGAAGVPKPAADGAAAAALAPRLPEAAAPQGAARPAETPGTVFVPEISTARITRGDSLWQISRRTYGKGNRYTVIYDANQEQIRDPDLIYPGQIFVLPKDAPAAADTPLPKRT